MKFLQGIIGGRVLLPGGDIEATDLAIADGRIAAIGATAPDRRAAGARLHAEGLLVLPGLVDIHGDAFERQLAPRPEARFPIDMALADTDRQLLANGISTAFHGITCSWEGGLRGLDMARDLLHSLSATRGLEHGPTAGFGADHRAHLRFENHHLEAVDEVMEWIAEGLVDFLAFNDHLPAIYRRIDDFGCLAKYAERAGISVDAFRETVLAARERSAEVPQAVCRLAVQAVRRKLAMASHDDATRADRERYQALGCAISEFPMRTEAALAAREFGNAVVMGSPNVVRGGSHIGGVSAADMVADGTCTVLASDYYYPAMLAAPFRLAAEGICTLAQAWPLVSRNPAVAAGLLDRGNIAAGLRADLILVDDTRPGLPRVVATLVAGVPRHVTRQFALR